MIIKKTYCTALVFFAALAIGGCVTPTKQQTRQDEEIAHSMPQPSYEKNQPPEGSLYNQNSMNLYKDNRAQDIGDIIMVKIVETSSGSKNAETTTERESEISGDLTSLFSFDKWMMLKNNDITGAKTLEASLINDFEGTGETSRDSSVTATISARVIDKTVNGNLKIRGHRKIAVNNETQHIILSGLVRPTDVSADNSIQSSQIADARIDYTGTGVLSEKQQPGWFARGIDILWPF
ncbi:MAG: flagellar basal body L-ring protein FlgH [Desulfurivibrionaceae bacterium]